MGTELDMGTVSDTILDTVIVYGYNMGCDYSICVWYWIRLQYTDIVSDTNMGYRKSTCPILFVNQLGSWKLQEGRGKGNIKFKFGGLWGLKINYLMSSQLINEFMVTICHYNYELKRGSNKVDNKVVSLLNVIAFYKCQILLFWNRIYIWTHFL